MPVVNGKKNNGFRAVDSKLLSINEAHNFLLTIMLKYSLLYIYKNEYFSGNRNMANSC